jgi:hypothetical protein
VAKATVPAMAHTNLIRTINCLLEEQQKLLEQLRINTQMITEASRTLLSQTQTYAPHPIVQRTNELLETQQQLMTHLQSLEIPAIKPVVDSLEKLQIPFQNMAGEIIHVPVALDAPLHDMQWTFYKAAGFNSAMNLVIPITYAIQQDGEFVPLRHRGNHATWFQLFGNQPPVVHYFIQEPDEKKQLRIATEICNYLKYYHLTNVLDHQTLYQHYRKWLIYGTRCSGESFFIEDNKHLFVPVEPTPSPAL